MRLLPTSLSWLNFEEVNLANDHNQMVMDLMNKIARHHGFRVLLHENHSLVSMVQESTTTGRFRPIQKSTFTLPEKIQNQIFNS